MGWLGKIFTWWDGSTIGTALGVRKATRVGSDDIGNGYFEWPKAAGASSLPRRWVIYSGANDASRVPPEWHAWLHHQVVAVPERSLPRPRRWEKEPRANLTGSNAAYRPSGALEAGGVRAAATGDYEAWNPDA